MKKLLAAIALIVSTAFPSMALADDATTQPQSTIVVQQPKHKWGGVDIFCGAPAGCVGSLLFRPFDWLKLGTGVGYNSMSPGVFAALTIDPMPWAFGITATVDGGHYWSGNVPFISNPPQVEYSFAEALGGIELGPRNKWRIYLRGGLTYIDATVSNLQNTIGTNNNNVNVGNLSVRGWIAPAAKIGFSIYF